MTAAVVPAASVGTRRAAPTAPAASQALRGTSGGGHELSDALERLLAEDPARSQLVHGGERSLVPRRDDLVGRHRSDARQRIELLGGGVVEVDQLRPPAWAGAEPIGAVVLAGSSRDGTRIWSPSARTAARRSSTATRAVSTRGPYPPAAATRSAIRAPAGRSEHARSDDRADDLDDHLARCRRAWTDRGPAIRADRRVVDADAVTRAAGDGQPEGDDGQDACHGDHRHGPDEPGRDPVGRIRRRRSGRGTGLLIVDGRLEDAP